MHYCGLNERVAPTLTAIGGDVSQCNKVQIYQPILIKIEWENVTWTERKKMLGVVMQGELDGVYIFVIVRHMDIFNIFS